MVPKCPRGQSTECRSLAPRGTCRPPACRAYGDRGRPRAEARPDMTAGPAREMARVAERSSAAGDPGRSRRRRRTRPVFERARGSSSQRSDRARSLGWISASAPMRSRRSTRSRGWLPRRSNAPLTSPDRFQSSGHDHGQWGGSDMSVAVCILGPRQPGCFARANRASSTNVGDCEGAVRKRPRLR
jgi:hypothetical protein